MKKYLSKNPVGAIYDLEEENIEVVRYITEIENDKTDYPEIRYLEVDSRYKNKLNELMNLNIFDGRGLSDYSDMDSIIKMIIESKIGYFRLVDDALDHLKIKIYYGQRTY